MKNRKTTKHTYYIYVAAMIIGTAASGFHCSAQKIDLLLNLDYYIKNEVSPGVWLDYQLDTRYFPTSTQRISLSRFQ